MLKWHTAAAHTLCQHQVPPFDIVLELGKLNTEEMGAGIGDLSVFEIVCKYIATSK